MPLQDRGPKGFDMSQASITGQSRQNPAIAFNPLQDGYFDDPYAHYAELREKDPVHLSMLGMPICFGFEDIRRVLTDGTTSMNKSRANEAAGLPPLDDDGELFSTAVIAIDAPDHTRIRRLMMTRSFTPRKVNALSDQIAADVDRLVGDVERRWQETGEPVDLVSTFAFPLPFKVISDLIGMPERDHQQVREWAGAFSAVTDPASGPEKVAAARVAYSAIRDYVTGEVLPWKRTHPADDLLSGLLVACDDGELTQQELVDQVCLLYVAGHETTVSLIANSILNLLRNRSQLERLRSGPEVLTAAIEELNRFDSAIQFGWRYTLSDLMIRDTVIPPGQMILLCLGSANRDPSHFGEDADCLVLDRPNAHEALSFGAGSHFCLGNALARREATMAIGKFFERFPNAELTGPPQWNTQITFRGLRSLEVALSS